MSEFVNYNKRSFLLPPGAKDLISLIPSESREIELFSTMDLSRVKDTREETALRPLSDLIVEVQKLVRPGPENRFLAMRSVKCRLAIEVSRDAAEKLSGNLVFPDDVVVEARLSEFFLREKLQLPPENKSVPPSFFPGVPVYSIWNIIPIPAGSEQLTGMIQRAFRQLCDLPDEAEIECVRMEWKYSAE